MGPATTTKVNTCNVRTDETFTVRESRKRRVRNLKTHTSGRQVCPDVFCLPPECTREGHTAHPDALPQGLRPHSLSVLQGHSLGACRASGVDAPYADCSVQLLRLMRPRCAMCQSHHGSRVACASHVHVGLCPKAVTVLLPVGSLLATSTHHRRGDTAPYVLVPSEVHHVGLHDGISHAST